ncbi:RNA polymerase sigma factor [Hirschia litorea]|uniref:RNA polymerase sigma factor n=1 Tax=Hirschia litorea TaxID=1199156 RepID=A0ABW2IP89_9PROT
MTPLLKAYIENKDSLQRFLRRYLSRTQDIEDVSQEAFLRTFMANRSKKINAPRAFLFQTAKNLALNELVKKSNTTTDNVEDIDVACGATWFENSVDVGYESKQKLVLLTEAVASLPSRCQKVFILRKIEGLKVKEIAHQLGISVSAVEKQIAIGILKCEDYLSERGYDPEDYGRGERSYGKKIPKSESLSNDGKVGRELKDD